MGSVTGSPGTGLPPLTISRNDLGERVSVSFVNKLDGAGPARPLTRPLTVLSYPDSSRERRPENAEERPPIRERRDLAKVQSARFLNSMGEFQSLDSVQGCGDPSNRAKWLEVAESMGPETR